MSKTINNIKFITMGELLLRLSPPNYEKIRTTDEFKVTYGGAEANVAASLSNLGIERRALLAVHLRAQRQNGHILS